MSVCVCAHVCVCVIRTSHRVLSVVFYFLFRFFGTIIPHPTDIAIPLRKFFFPLEQHHLYSYLSILISCLRDLKVELLVK